MRRRRALPVNAFVLLTLCGVAGCGNSSPTNPQPPTFTSQHIRGASPLFGYSDLFASLGSGAGNDNTVELAASGGANVIRFVVQWGAAQHYNDDNSLSPIRMAPAVTSVYAHAIAAGIRPILIVQGAPWNSHPDPADPNSQLAMTCTTAPGATPRTIPKDNAYALGKWRAFVQAVADNFPDALAIEVWNEENTSHMWGDCLPTELGHSGAGSDTFESHYTHLLKYAYDGVKGSQHPNVPILLGSTAPGGSSDTGAEINWRQFLGDVLDRTQDLYGDHLVDAVGIHPYRGKNDLGDPSLSKPEQFAHSATSQVREARAVLDNHRAGGLPVWVTEVGASTGGPTGHPIYAGVGTDTGKALERDQAEALDKIYAGLAGMHVPVVIVYSLADELNLSGWQSGAGVTTPTLDNGRLTYPYTLKCAYYYLGRDRGTQSVPSSCR